MSDTNPGISELNPQDARLAGMLKALGNPIRFRMMQYLADHQMCITGDVVEFTSLAQSTVSQHLKVLREAELIRGEVEGPATCYCINPEGIQFLKARIEQWLPDCCNPIPDQKTGKCC
jgi:ArsR family transcriptional regulator